MNGHSLSLQSYCSLTKEFFKIKKIAEVKKKKKIISSILLRMEKDYKKEARKIKVRIEK